MDVVGVVGDDQRKTQIPPHGHQTLIDLGQLLDVLVVL